jgi:hypothetical protein
LEEQSYELEDHLGNLENLNKIKVQTSMANGHFWIISPKESFISILI